MSLIVGVIVITIFSILLLTIVGERQKGNVALFGVLVNAILSSYIAIPALLGKSFEQSFYGGSVFGQIVIRVDALSGWFILLMNFTMLTGILYGRRYMKQYEDASGGSSSNSVNLTFHFASYILNHFAMLGIYCAWNSLVFLCVWELMALTS